MARVVDGTTLGNEREYARTFNTNNELVSSLSYGIVLTDDPYADARPVKIAGGRALRARPRRRAPRRAPGADHPLAVDSYRTSLGVLDASTAAVSGYDFLSDGATDVKDALTTNGTNVNSSLISNAWSKARPRAGARLEHQQAAVDQRPLRPQPGAARRSERERCAERPGRRQRPHRPGRPAGCCSAWAATPACRSPTSRSA